MYKDHFDSGLPDTVWIPEIARRAWIIVTGDIQTKFKSVEIETIVLSHARILHVVNRQTATHPVLAQNFVNTLPRITSFLRNNPAPCLATITRPSKKEDYWSGEAGNVNPQQERILKVQIKLKQQDPTE